MAPITTSSKQINKVKSENGATLIELVVTIIILGIVIPSMFTVIGQLGIHHVQNEGAYRAISFANTKMEEIVAFKNNNNDWTDNINGFAGSESLIDGYTRIVSVTAINNWINVGSFTKNAFEVNIVAQPPLGTAYNLTVILAVD